MTQELIANMARRTASATEVKAEFDRLLPYATRRTLDAR